MCLSTHQPINIGNRASSLVERLLVCRRSWVRIQPKSPVKYFFPQTLGKHCVCSAINSVGVGQNEYMSLNQTVNRTVKVINEI